MSAEVIEDGMTGFEGITHYKRRREELVGGAYLNGADGGGGSDGGGVDGITHYKRRREELVGGAYLNGITHYKRRREELIGGALLNGITPYKRYRDERDGWSTNADGLDPKPGDVVRYEVEDGYRNAPSAGYEGLSDAVMTIEGLSGLFDFPHMGKLEEMLKPSAAENAPVMSPPSAAAITPAQVNQVNVLKDLLDKRRAVIVESDAKIAEMLKSVMLLDGQIASMAKSAGTLFKKGDTNGAQRIAGEAVKLDKERTKSAKRAVRYAKLRVLAGTLARNAKSQIVLVDLAQNARERGDKAGEATFAGAFQEIGSSTAKIHNLRREQQEKWGNEDQRDAVAALSGMEDIPAIWASGDLRAELKALYKKIAVMQKNKAPHAETQPLFDRAYNLRRMVEETRGQGLQGLEWWPYSDIKSGVKALAKGTASVIKTVASAGVKLGKFAACGILAKPGVLAAAGAGVGTIVPGAGTVAGGAAGAGAGALLGAACTPAQKQAAIAAGVDPYLVTGNVMDKPLAGGIRLKHVLIGAGVLAVGGTGAYLALRRPHTGVAGMDPYATYGFKGLHGMDPYSTYGFSGTKRKKRRGGKKGRRGHGRAPASIENWIVDSFR
jgi:hypothetical protein